MAARRADSAWRDTRQGCSRRPRPSFFSRPIDGVKGEGIKNQCRNSELGEAYSNDSIRYTDSLSVELVTPATKAGTGTEGDLAPSPRPVSGFVTLDTLNDWSLSVLRVRVSPGMAQLAPVIVKLNRECVGIDRC